MHGEEPCRANLYGNGDEITNNSGLVAHAHSHIFPFSWSGRGEIQWGGGLLFT